MVTAHINGQKAVVSESLQTSPINLQTVHSFSSRRPTELQPPQMLGTLTAVPIKVPQVSSLHRLAGQATNVLPQVRPKTQIPDSLPHSPCQELQPLSLQRATAVVSPRSQGPTLPTTNSSSVLTGSPNSHSDAVSPPPAPPHSLPGGSESSSPTQHASAGPGVAYAIIATGNGVSTVSEAVKLSRGQADLPTQEAPPTPRQPSQKKGEDSDANAWASHYLNSSLFLSARGTTWSMYDHCGCLSSVWTCGERLLGQQKDTQASLDRLKSLIRLIQREQVIQVTMTTTASIAASLLSPSWIKPTGATTSCSSTAPLQTGHARDDVTD
ncbi:unnamed protein product [Lampetra planeri]